MTEFNEAFREKYTFGQIDSAIESKIAVSTQSGESCSFTCLSNAHSYWDDVQKDGGDLVQKHTQLIVNPVSDAEIAAVLFQDYKELVCDSSLSFQAYPYSCEFNYVVLAVLPRSWDVQTDNSPQSIADIESHSFTKQGQQQIPQARPFSSDLGCGSYTKTQSWQNPLGLVNFREDTFSRI